MSAALSLGLLVLVGFLLVFGRDVFALDREGVGQFLTAVRESPWSFPATALLFTGLALVGFPQAILFAATVAVFGPFQGAAYSWFATMISGAVTYGLGRGFGERWVRRISQSKVQGMIAVMRRRGILGSMIVRWTPSAPFIVVNALCGSAGMPYWKFAVGTGLGIVPKIALIAFFTEQIDAFWRFLTSGDLSALISIAALVAAWIGFMVFCRWLYRRVGRSSLAGLTGQTALSEESTVSNATPTASLNHKINAP